MKENEYESETDDNIELEAPTSALKDGEKAELAKWLLGVHEGAEHIAGMYRVRGTEYGLAFKALARSIVESLKALEAEEPSAAHC
jgi:hypothetical protein